VEQGQKVMVLVSMRRSMSIAGQSRSKRSSVRATYQLFVLSGRAACVLCQGYETKFHSAAPTLEGYREHCILRTVRTLVIDLLLHWLESSRGKRSGSVRRDSTGKWSSAE
jgi:hypothetical protein